MKYIETKLDELWAFIVKAKGRCLFCGSTYNLQPHHVFRGRWKSVWFFRWMPIFGVCLCDNCHNHSPFSPHNNKDPKAFWLKLEETLIRTDPEKMKFINLYRTNKCEVPERPALDTIRKDLQQQVQNINETGYMDNYVDEIYKGRDAQNRPIWGRL